MLSDSYVPLAQSASGRYSARFLSAVDRALAVRPEQRTQSIEAFRVQQRQAFHDERERWKASGQDGSLSELAMEAPPDDDALPEGATAVGSPVPGSVWKVLVAAGDAVAEGQTLAVVESMKMEFPVLAPMAGTVQAVRCSEGGGVTAGQTVVVLT